MPGRPFCVTSGRRANHRRGKSFKKLPIRGAHQNTIFRVPFDSDRERRARHLERFDDTVTGYGGHDQPLAHALHRLMMPRIHIVPAPADDLS